LNPQTWVLKGSTLSVDHRSRFLHILTTKQFLKQTLFICLLSQGS